MSITTLTVTNIIVEEEGELIDESERSLTNQRIEKQVLGKHAKELVTRLQLLGDYEGLLTPPEFVISVAQNIVWLTCFMEEQTYICFVAS